MCIVACSSKEHQCAQQDAMVITLIDDAGNCDFDGEIEYKGDVFPMQCGIFELVCSCSAGVDAGIYRVKITNHSTNITDTGLIEATSTDAPQCFDRRAIEPFQPSAAMGGAKG